jgi:DNA-binding beta-propeller fold protein YncE
VALAFSPDPAQKFVYAANEDDEQIEIIDRANGKVLSSFGRVGHQMGEFMHAECIAVDSKGNIYVGEGGFGEAPALLLAAAGREPSDAAAVCIDGAALRVAALASGIGQTCRESGLE